VSATVIPFNNERPANDAAATLAMPAETVDLRLPRDYYLPRGMGPRQYHRLFWAILNSADYSEERQALLKAMDAVQAAKRLFEVAVKREHEILFAVMRRDHPSMARRVMAAMKRQARPTGRGGSRPHQFSTKVHK
jgi:hypothetical protein